MAPSAPRVFISYSHDSLEHARRVMGLAERLRKDGVDTQLDQYVAGTPARGWPRWMEEQLDSSEFVLVICTETYRRRFLGREEPDNKGKGADWEGSLITSELYYTRSDTNKFVPMLFDHQDEPFIPRPLSGHTHYLLSSEDNYAKLYAFLTGQAGVLPGKLGPLKTRVREAVDPLTFGGSDEEISAAGKLDGVLDRPSRDLPQKTDSGALRNSGSRPSKQGTLSQERWREIALYGVISLISFLCGVVLLGLMILNADLLGRLGLTGNLYYLVLLPMGLAAAGFLFGVLRSYSRYSGKQLGGMLELGGSNRRISARCHSRIRSSKTRDDISADRLCPWERWSAGYGPSKFRRRSLGSWTGPTAPADRCGGAGVFSRDPRELPGSGGSDRRGI